MNNEICVEFLLKDHPKMPVWKINVLDRPWSVVITEGGTILDKWDAAAIGYERPSVELLLATEADALTWHKCKDITTGMVQKAAVFKAILTQYFGEGAEVNPVVDEETVTNYFASLPAITSAQVRDAILLSRLFEVLRQPDGTTWSFPWIMLDPSFVMPTPPPLTPYVPPVPEPEPPPVEPPPEQPTEPPAEPITNDPLLTEPSQVRDGQE